MRLKRSRSSHNVCRKSKTIDMWMIPWWINGKNTRKTHLKQNENVIACPPTTQQKHEQHNTRTTVSKTMIKANESNFKVINCFMCHFHSISWPDSLAPLCVHFSLSLMYTNRIQFVQYYYAESGAIETNEKKTESKWAMKKKPCCEMQSQFWRKKEQVTECRLKEDTGLGMNSRSDTL